MTAPACLACRRDRTGEPTCGSCDYRDDGFVHRCYEPALYRAEFRWLGDDGEDYTVPVCVRHAATARTHDSLKRIYTGELTCAAVDHARRRHTANEENAK